MRKKILIAFFISIMITSVNIAQAATYYMPDDFANLQSAFVGMSGGDTLIIRDGTYTGDSNSITTNQCPRQGNAGAWTVIRAEHPGEVVFDGENSRNMFDHEPNLSDKYWQFEGLIWCRATGSNVLMLRSRYVKFLYCGAYDAGDGNAVNFGVGNGSEYVLLENCYAYGSGRYKFLTGSTDHIVLRNCVGRLDRVNAPYEPIAVFSIYGADDIEVQNCIAIDSDQYSYWNYDQMSGGFFVPSTSGPANRVNFTNCISLNNRLGGISTTGTEAYAANDVTFRNCIVWDSYAYDGGSSNMIRGLRTSILNTTLGVGTGQYPYINSYDGIGYNNNTTLTNSIIYNYTGTNEAYAVNDIETDDYNCYYGNSFGNEERTVLGTHTLTNTNPMNNSLRYICRIETGSDLDGAGESGADIGASVFTTVGVSGTLWGQSGYNTEQSTDMWPFPNEDLIRTKMKAYNAGGVSGDRGFCADGQTLTKYIWEYLGNTIPADIYGSSALNITTSSLNSGLVNTAYSQTVSATGGTTPYTWALSSGSLPAGLSLNSSTGVITGTPTGAGTANFVIGITDNAAATDTQSLSIVIAAADTTAPVISSVASTDTTSSGATITWTTNESATSLVEYGTTLSYGTSTTIDTTLVTSHSVAVSGLNSNSTYHFRVKSKDAANNEAISADSTFVTAGYTDFTSLSSTLNLQNFELIPEEGTMTVNIPVNPATADSAEIILTLYDAENHGEGNFYINNNGETEIPYGDAYDAVEHTFDPITINKNHLVEGSNIIRFTHLATSGYRVNGVIIRLNFSGGSDTTAPATISNFSAVTGSSDGQVALTWTAPGDDGSSGTVSSYDVRYSSATINDINWASASQVSGEPTPSAAGASESMTVSGLTAGQTYYFAIKSQDEVPNVSGLSNIPSAQAKLTVVVSDTTAPYTTGHNPVKSAVNIAPDANIVVHVKDDGAGVDINTIVMKVNGVNVTPTITGTPADYTLTYNPPADFNDGQEVTVTVNASDLAP